MGVKLEHLTGMTLEALVLYYAWILLAFKTVEEFSFSTFLFSDSISHHFSITLQLILRFELFFT
jgi:hypothetical protein